VTARVDVTYLTEEDFHELVDFVLDYLAVKALGWKKIPATQRWFVERAIDGFKVEAEMLTNMLRKLPATERDGAFAALSKLLDATMHIAGSASASETAKLHHESEAQKRRGSKPRRPTTQAQRIDELASKYRKLRTTTSGIARAVVENWDNQKIRVPDVRTVERRLKKSKPVLTKGERK